MASTTKQGKSSKASHKTVLKWEKEFNTTFGCDLEGKDVVRLCCTLYAKWERLICSIKIISHNYIHLGSTSVEKHSIKSHCLSEPQKAA